MTKRKLSFFTRPGNTFVTVGIIFGILFLLITPPFQAPDEYNHFYRSFQVSEGKIIAEKEQNQIGGTVPSSLVVTTVKVSKDIRFHPEIQQKVEDIFSLLNLPLESQNRLFVAFPNTALYSPIPYLPQAAGIALGKIVGFSPINLMYIGRIFNLLFWVLLGYLSIKLTPILKWVFFLLALTPMSLFLAASLSADAVTNGISLLLIAVFLRCALDDTKIIKFFDVLIIFLLSLSLIFAKQAYFPLVFLFLLIPTEKIGNKKKYFITFASLLLLSLVVLVAWSFFTKGLYISFTPESNVSPSKQLVLIFTNPFRFLKTMLDTLSLYKIEYKNQFIGKLGWLDTELPTNYVDPYVIMLLVISLVSNHRNVLLSYSQKIIIFITLVLNVFVLFTVAYLIWQPIGGNIINGIQGRYFIPMAPLLFLLFYNQKININMKKISLIVSFYSLFSEILTIFILLHRYYL